MADTLARTLEDVKRLAPTAGFYWVRKHHPWRDLSWAVFQLRVNRDGVRRWQFISGHMREAELLGARIIGPIIPPEAP